MRYFFLFFLVFFVSCNSNNKLTQKDKAECENNNDCDFYEFCIKNECKNYSDYKFSSIQELKDISVGSFIIMSDNKGDADEDKRFKNMVEWSRKIGIDFIIGLGDHLKINWPNKFLDFLKNNDFWFNNFYPAVADGENEYYGNGQGDWGAGGKFLEFLEFSKRKNTVLRSNGAEYYTKIKIKDLTIHLIQLHFPDTPRDADVAWPPDSREYLVNTLKSINKTNKDLVIVGAHSINGKWYQYLNAEQLEVVKNKVDLGLSATIHVFGRYKTGESPYEKVLFLNTGSITRPSINGGEGFILVFVLENPYRIVLQYVDPKKKGLEFDTRYPVYVKDISGFIKEVSYKE